MTQFQINEEAIESYVKSKTQAETYRMYLRDAVREGIRIGYKQGLTAHLADEIVDVTNNVVGKGTNIKASPIPTVERINLDIEKLGNEKALVSDGYHTFSELYDHRVTLWIAFCKYYSTHPKMIGEVWRTHLHSDGSNSEGWFVLGMFTEAGKQMTYHLPIHLWNDCNFAYSLAKAPDWDGHTSSDVLQRLKEL